MPEQAYMPAQMSAMDTPTLAGDSSVPVTLKRPASHWTSMSYAFFC